MTNQTVIMAQAVKNLPEMEEDEDSVPGLRRSPGRGNGNPLLYSCLENPMDRGTKFPTVQRVTKSWTRLSIGWMEAQNNYIQFRGLSRVMW